MSGWGSGGWGSSGWGGGDPPDPAIASAQPVRENVLRIVLTVPAFVSGLFDAHDAADPSHYVVAPVAGTVGADGLPTKPVTVVSAAASEGVFGGLDLTLDRPMSPFPARYSVTASDLASAIGLTPLGTLSAQVDGLFKVLVPNLPDRAIPGSRDFANPQSVAAFGSGALPLGSIPVDETGDYALDVGLASLKKRIFRRLITRTSAFAHLPGYGVGVPDMGKKLATSAAKLRAVTEAERQIRLEPEVLKAKVAIVEDAGAPGLFRYVILVRTRAGTSTRLEMTVGTG